MGAGTLGALMVTGSLALGSGSTAVAATEIVPGEGMANVELGMQKRQVIDVIGKPKIVKKGRHEFGRYKTLRYGVKGRKLTVNLLRGRVIMVSTEKRSELTSSGVGVGSTKKQVRRRVPGVRCQSALGLCHVNEFLPGEKVTTFHLESGKVTRVDVGTVID